MPVAYVAGPMRGYQEFNFPAFKWATDLLYALGYEVLSPAEHELDLGFDPRTGMYTGGQVFSLRDSLTWDTVAVLRSDVVVTLPGSELSLGALAEIALARAAGIPAYALDQVPAANASAVVLNG